MDYLKAHAQICCKHIESDCIGCPFKEAAEVGSCNRFIYKNVDRAKEMIRDYARSVKMGCADGQAAI